jgi:hypothetical protein
MNKISAGLLVKLTMLLTLPWVARAQAPQPAGTLTIAGRPDQAAVVRIRGKSYVDIESLARILHGSIRNQGTQTILTLPQTTSTTAAAPPAQPVKAPQLSGGYLAAEIEALTAIREWRVALMNAVQNNSPVTEDWTGRLRRGADTKLQLAVAAATNESDHRALDLLKNEFTNMQQMNDQYVSTHAKVNYISPDSFDNNSLDKKIVSCDRGLVAMTATKEFQDEPTCH